MTALLAFLACAVVVMIAARAIGPERERVFPCAVALSLGWLWFQSAWLTHSPASVIYGLSGASLEPVWLWAAMDACIGFYIFSKAYDRMWGYACFCLFIVQELIHALYLAQTLSFWAYSEVLLDVTFYMQVACLAWGGRSGFANWIGRPHDARGLRPDADCSAALVRSQEPVE